MRIFARVAALLVFAFSLPITASAGGYIGFGGGPRSGPLFTGDMGATLCLGFIHTSESPVELGIGIAGNLAYHNFSSRDGYTDSAGVPDFGKVAEIVLRPEFVFHSRGASPRRRFYAGGGLSAAQRTISLEKFATGGGPEAVILTGEWGRWLNGLANSTPQTPGKGWSIKNNLMGWHARVGMRFSAVVLELLHEQAFDSQEDLGGTSFVMGLAW